MNEINPKRYARPKDIPRLYPVFTETGIRWYLKNRHKNGLCACVNEIGRRKLIIDLDKFEEWIDSKHN